MIIQIEYGKMLKKDDSIPNLTEPMAKPELKLLSKSISCLLCILVNIVNLMLPLSIRESVPCNYTGEPALENEGGPRSRCIEEMIEGIYCLTPRFRRTIFISLLQLHYLFIGNIKVIYKNILYLAF